VELVYILLNLPPRIQLETKNQDQMGELKFSLHNPINPTVSPKNLSFKKINQIKNNNKQIIKL